MFENLGADYKTLVLLRVIENIIKHTEVFGVYRLEKILEDKNPKPIDFHKLQRITKEEKIERIKEIVKKKLNAPLDKKELSKESLNKEKFIPSKKIKRDSSISISGLNNKMSKFPMANFSKKRLIVPRDELPAHLNYLKPTKSYSMNLDLGKLNVLLYDKNVNVIECEGENKNIIVSGRMGRKPTIVKLNQEEIDEVIDIFSKKSKIPAPEGLFKVSVGDVHFTAMISKSISSRFIIKKL